MADEKLREDLALLSMRLLAVRDVVARLLAYEAARWPDPAKIYEDFSEATDSHIHDVSKRKQLTPQVIALQEAMRKEVDWIVAAARKMVPPDEES